MKNYELALVLKSSLSEADQKKLIDEIKADIAKDGKVNSDAALGRKTLAYRIKHETNGVFFVLNFEASAQTPKNLVRKFRIDENILRFILEQREVQPANVK